MIAHQRYAHAKQFKRANRALKTIRTYLGRVTRDIVRKIGGDAELESVFAIAHARPPGARAAPASARTQKLALGLRPEGLLAACARGRMHSRPGAFGTRTSKRALQTFSFTWA